MASQFVERMSRSPDEELIRIAFSDAADGFVSEAIDAARAELDRRGVTTDAIESVQEQVELEKAEEAAKVETPLSTWAFFTLVFVGPITFWPVIILYATGRRQKTRDAVVATLVGIAFWGTISVIMAMLGP
jgi:hypothetical protein